MDIEKLAQLNSLKEKGVITQEEFEIQKKEILNNEEDVLEKHRFNWKDFSIISGTLVIAVSIIVWFYSGNINFACDESSMEQAQKLLNNTFLNWNNSLRLMKPITVSKSENFIRCKTETNLRDFPVIYYNLERQANGEILITSNPVGDALNKAAKDFENSMNNLVNDIW